MQSVGMGEVLLRLAGIRKVYDTGGPAYQALSGIDLTVDRGEMVALRGPSGCGKSTLLHLLGCLDRPTEGQYWFGGIDVSGMSKHEQARFRNEHIGFVFQAFHLLADLTAAENVELPLVYSGVGAAERRRRAVAKLTALGIGHLADRRPSEMSGGQRQRIAVSRALVTEPPVLLADEPTGNLDSKATKEVLALFREIHAQGLTVVIVTHDDHVGRAAERQIQIRDGRVADDGRGGGVSPGIVAMEQAAIAAAMAGGAA